MTRYIDITLPLKSKMPFWPNSPGFNLTWLKSMQAGDKNNGSKIETDIHAGTHTDAPLHFINNGLSVDRIPLEKFIGKCEVVYIPDVSVITPFDLEKLSIPDKTNRLLIKTKNSEIWNQNTLEFYTDFTALDVDAASWLADRNFDLVGIDYLSIQKYKGNPLTHTILFEASIVVLEGLNLYNVSPGTYELICLPLKIEGAEGSPVRAVLNPIIS